MALATATILGIGLAAKVGTDIAGGIIASKASKKAAQQQTRATEDAQKRIDDVWMPYVNKGREAISTLGRLTAAPPGSRFAAPDPTMGQRPSPRQSPQPSPRPAGPQGHVGNMVGQPMYTFGAMAQPMYQPGPAPGYAPMMPPPEQPPMGAAPFTTFGDLYAPHRFFDPRA